ncbi:MAG: hypothetical protein ACXWVD_05215, partial [Telluria sp.]
MRNESIRLTPCYERRLAFSTINGDSALFFEPDEIEGPYLLTELKMPDNRKLNEVLPLIARLGGGILTIWLGLKEIHIAAKTLGSLRQNDVLDSTINGDIAIKNARSKRAF